MGAMLSACLPSAATLPTDKAMSNEETVSNLEMSVLLDEAVARTTEDLARATKAFDASTYAQPSLLRRGGDIEHTTVEHCGGTATRFRPASRAARFERRRPGRTTTHRRP